MTRASNKSGRGVLLLTVLLNIARTVYCQGDGAGVPQFEHHVNKDIFKNFKLNKDTDTISYDNINRILRDENQPSYRYKRSLEATANMTINSLNISTTSAETTKQLNLRSSNITALTNLNISQLSELETFDLSDNRIAELQKANFAGLKKLKCLNLSSNHLTRIHKDTFSNLLTVDTLILAHNNITVIDFETFLLMPTLQYLDLSANRLHGAAIRALQGIPDLVGLSIAYNEQLGASMQEFVASWSLKELDASGTGLCRIPAALVQSVRALRLNDNWLQRINCGDLDSYPLLQFLDLSYAHIAHIEDDALGRLEILETLFLDHNELKHVPISLPTSLEQLFLQNNQIMDIQSQTFQGLKSLQILDLSGNKLLYLPDLPLPKLLTLNLQSSELKGLSQSIVQTSPHLRDLLLNGNPIKCSDLLGIAEWASPCQNDRIPEPTDIKQTFLSTQIAYFKRFRAPAVLGNVTQPKCASSEEAKRINNRSIKIAKRVQQQQQQDNQDVTLNTTRQASSINNETDSGAKLHNSSDTSTTTTTPATAPTKHSEALSQTGSDSNYVTETSSGRAASQEEGLNIPFVTTAAAQTDKNLIRSQEAGSQAHEHPEHTERMPTAGFDGPRPGNENENESENNNEKRNVSNLYKIDEIHIKDRHLLGTPLMVHKGHALVEARIGNLTAPGQLPTAAADGVDTKLGQGAGMLTKSEQFSRKNEKHENVILKTNVPLLLQLPENEKKILATANDDNDEVADSKFDLMLSGAKKDEHGPAVKIENPFAEKKDHFRLNTPITRGDDDESNSNLARTIDNHVEVKSEANATSDEAHKHHHAINTPRDERTTLAPTNLTTSISTKPEQWLDIRTAKGHPGLLVVIGVTFGVLLILGLVQVYRCRKPSLRHHHHHSDHQSLSHRHYGCSPPPATWADGEAIHQQLYHPDDSHSHLQGSSYDDRLDLRLVSEGGGSGSGEAKRYRKKCNHSHDENDYYVELSHECQARVQSDFLPMELLSPRRSTSPVHVVRAAADVESPQQRTRFDVW